MPTAARGGCGVLRKVAERPEVRSHTGAWEPVHANQNLCFILADQRVDLLARPHELRTARDIGKYLLLIDAQTVVGRGN